MVGTTGIQGLDVSPTIHPRTHTVTIADHDLGATIDRPRE
jgi:hypothetical protein